MRTKIEEKYEDYVLEEYRALREESLRSASIISNTIWISTSAFVVTIGGGITILQDNNNLGSLFLILIIIQSFAANVMFLSELWKYSRVGFYIRTEIEKIFQDMSSKKGIKSPIYWEHWIEKRRAIFYYLASIIVLLSPALLALLFWFIIASGKQPSSDILKWLLTVRKESALYYTIPILAILNLLFAFYMLLKIWIMTKNEISVRNYIKMKIKKKNIVQKDDNDSNPN